MIISPFEPPVERAVVPERGPALMKRQPQEDDDEQSPLESFISGIFGPDPTTTTRSRPVPSTGRPTPTLTSDDDNETTTRRTTTSSSTTSTSSSSTPIPTATPVTRPAPSSSTRTVVLTSESPVASDVNSQEKTGGLSSVAIGVIVAASVIFGLIFLALIARKFFQARRRARRGTWGAGIIAPFEPPPPIEKDIGYSPAAKGSTAYGRLGQNSPATSQMYNSASLYPSYAYTYGNTATYPNPTFNAPFSESGGGASANANIMFNQTSYTAADLSGAVPITRTPSPPAQVLAVRRTFSPSLPDELAISVGDSVKVLATYDDGWALCQKVASGDQGVVPLECLDTPGSGNLDAPSTDAQLKRQSSLRTAQ